MAQPQGFKNLIHKGPVLGNDPVPQPFDDTLTGGIQVKGHQMFVFLIDGHDFRNKALQTPFLHPKPHKLRIINAEAVNIAHSFLLIFQGQRHLFIQGIRDP